MTLASERRKAVLLFCFYFALWILANLPATSQPWWAGDDYGIARDYLWVHNYWHGRPLANLIHAPLAWETGTWGAVANMAFRSLQGAAHAGAALIAALMLYRATQSRTAIAAATIFLLWPFNGEAVYWRAAGGMPVSALLSVAGALLVSRAQEQRRPLLAVLAAGMVAAAVLVHQLGAMAGLVLWAAILVVQSEPPGRRALGGLLWLSGGYALGAIASKLIARAWMGDLPGRDQLATDFWSRFALLRHLWQDFFWYPFSAYQQYFQVLVAALLIVALAAQILYVYESWRARTIRLAAAASLLVLPYAPLLLTTGNTTSMRLQYLAPFLFVAACVAASPWLERLFRAPGAGVVLAGALVAVYLPIAFVNAGDFVAVYEADLKRLADLRESILDESPPLPAQVVVADQAIYHSSFDPHGVLHMVNSDAKLSAFLLPWAIGNLIEWRTDLHPLTEPAEVEQCSLACRDAAAEDGGLEPFTVLHPDDESPFCVCP